MKKFPAFVIAVVVLALAPSSCVEPQEDVVAAQHSANWRNAAPDALAVAKEMPPPDISPETHLAAGKLFESQNHVNKAIVQYRKAIAVDPQCAEAYTRLGVLFGRIGYHSEAETHLKQAIDLRPQSPSIRNNLGYEYIMQGRWTDAEAELRNSIRLAPEFKRAHINLGVALCKQGRFDEGLGAFEQAVPEADAFYNLGLMLRAAHQYQEAADAFAHALRLEPRLSAARIQIEQIADRVGFRAPPEPVTDAQYETASAEALTGAAAPAISMPDDNPSPVAGPEIVIEDPAADPAIATEPDIADVQEPVPDIDAGKPVAEPSDDDIENQNAPIPVPDQAIATPEIVETAPEPAEMNHMLALASAGDIASIEMAIIDGGIPSEAADEPVNYDESIVPSDDIDAIPWGEDAFCDYWTALEQIFEESWGPVRDGLTPPPLANREDAPSRQEPIDPPSPSPIRMRLMGPDAIRTDPDPFELPDIYEPPLPDVPEPEAT